MGYTVLLVEDDQLVRDMLSEVLSEVGFTVVQADSVSSALAALTTQVIETAVLDINLGEELVFPVAFTLQAWHIPFLFTSGADPETLPCELRSHSFMPKPYGVFQVVQWLQYAIHGRGAAGTPT